MGFATNLREMVRNSSKISEATDTTTDVADSVCSDSSSDLSADDALELTATLEEPAEREQRELPEHRPRIEVHRPASVEGRPQGRVPGHLRASVARARHLSISVSELVLAKQDSPVATRRPDRPPSAKAEDARSDALLLAEAAPEEEPAEAVATEALRTPAPEGTVFFFDWDDTLLPTSAAVVGGWSGSPDPEQVPALTQHALLVRDLLHTARSIGHVAIITLAKRPWVQFTASTYLPGVDWDAEFKELGISVIYAREVLGRNLMQQALKEQGVDLFVRSKIKAMSKALRSFRRAGGGAEILNLISIGDSKVESEAAKELAWGMQGDIPCKTVKLQDEPSTVRELSSQLRDLLALLPSIANAAEDFDLTLEEAKSEDSVLGRASPYCLAAQDVADTEKRAGIAKGACGDSLSRRLLEAA